MKISASLFSVKQSFINYAEKLKFAGADYLHLDYLEGVKPPIDIAKLPEISLDSILPIDVHLIQSQITKEDIEILNKSKVKNLTIQYENIKDFNDLENLKAFNGSWGIGIVADTPLSVIKPYEKCIDHIMVMCTEPGVSGAKFDYRNINRISNINETFPNLKVQVDGGIEQLKASILKPLKVDLIVSGSYLANSGKLFEQIYKLKYGNDYSIMIEKIMVKRVELPCVKVQESFIDIIELISNYRMGIAFVIDDEYRLKGIITDREIRMGLISFKGDILLKTAADIMNNNPYIISIENSIYQMMEELTINKNYIRIIPIIKDNKLMGAIDLKRNLYQ